jgi:hypothetical protein
MSERGRLSFAASLASGTYDVALTMGDADYSKPGQSIWLEGSQIDTVSMAVGQFLVKTYRVNVADGQLNLDVYAANGGRAVVVNAMVVTPVTTGGITTALAASPTPLQAHDAALDDDAALAPFWRMPVWTGTELELTPLVTGPSRKPVAGKRTGVILSLS